MSSYLDGRVQVLERDITRLQVDAIVNAANETLSPGGGVCGAIHRAAGPELAEACRKLGGARTGDARITPGFDLPAKFVIHAVGPVWRGGEHGEDQLLASAYRRSLELARDNGAASVAFTSISTGIFGFPIDRAAPIALLTVRAFLENAPDLRVLHVCFSRADLAAYEQAARELLRVPV